MYTVFEKISAGHFRRVLRTDDFDFACAIVEGLSGYATIEIR